MLKFFNTGGPCRPELHYMLPATERLKRYNVMRLIQQQAYFVLHAPRQIGKTTAILELAHTLTASGDYVGIVLSCETGAPFKDDTETAEGAIVSSWRIAILGQLEPQFHPSKWSADDVEGGIIGRFLTNWATELNRPLVVFLDEIDALEDEPLISVLRQLRSGYYNRPAAFPASLTLIGLRDIRDYKVKSGGKDRLRSPSPFNIAVRSLTLQNFSAEEVQALLQQHIDQTGQPFTPAAIDRIFYLTQGQPWLVNSLAKVCVEELNEDVATPITLDHVDEAKEILIRRRQTHLDSLTDKLYESRVQHVIEPILAGQTLESVPFDDIEYLLDLGLVRMENGSGLKIANPIYQEIIPRVLSLVARASLPEATPIWRNVDGTINPDNLLTAFLKFWRQHGQPLLKTTRYHEIAPHIVLMAFLHRVVNGGGTIDREYAIGRGRMDLLLRKGEQRFAFELKTWRDGEKDPTPDALIQLDRYLDGLGMETGWLVIFDQRSGLPPIAERTSAETVRSPAGREVTVVLA